jgi:hypothetical protein
MKLLPVTKPTLTPLLQKRLGASVVVSVMEVPAAIAASLLLPWIDDRVLVVRAHVLVHPRHQLTDRQTENTHTP